MAQNLSELCTLLVDDLYGGLSSTVFSVLARLGRLPLNALKHHSDLTPKQLKHGLVVLIQQHLVLHNTSEDDETTYYEVHWANAYALVRSGKIIKLCEDRFGESAGGIISNLLLLGHAKVKDLAEAYNAAVKKHSEINPEANHINGEGLPNSVGKDTHSNGAASHIRSVGELHRILNELIQAGYVRPVRDIHFRPMADITADAEQIVKREKFPTGIKGPKGKADFVQEVNNLKRKWIEGDDEKSVTNGVKRRPANGYVPQSHKRARLNGASNGVNGHFDSDSDDEFAPTLDQELVVRVNYDKCNVGLRNQQLVTLAARFIGETTATVYETLLTLLEQKIPRCHDEYHEFEDEEAELKALPSITLLQVTNALDPELDLSAGISLSQDLSNGVSGDNTPDPTDRDSIGNHINGVNGSGSSTPNTARDRMKYVEQHLKLLAEDPRKFILRSGSRGGGEWQVNFRQLTNKLVQFEIENTIMARFGSLAIRLVRILCDKGKLDEKAVANIGLLKQKDIRSTFTAMQEAGFVELQEVPKDAARQPSRTIFLWFFDQDRCRRVILAETYKAMARLIQRANVEKEKIQPLLDKAERTDVVGNEDRYLSAKERQTLRIWRSTEEKLLTQLGRQDDLVAILRDYGVS
ncbi:RNA polymerase III subunit C82 [Coniosporium apollinis]|uniref:DNA-directed RNA polymerase III subunit RPC3 n=1 Tax=Coniosporium apollinis TaxID=61459 RepID=A0ABQ9NSQ2_9PEZI|nr:RNA polymerase III subunit C82 [Coniosporium apollinis]